GGVARYIFYGDLSINIPRSIVDALAYVSAMMGDMRPDEPSNILRELHGLVNMLVGTSEIGSPHQFLGLDLASRYIGQKLLEQNPAQMMTYVQNMLAGIQPSDIA
ncbi:hypothetical protein BJ741DRAFT_509795, partial [Chytriomyces cf. hyalinus JEL632]